MNSPQRGATRLGTAVLAIVATAAVAPLIACGGSAEKTPVATPAPATSAAAESPAAATGPLAPEESAWLDAVGAINARVQGDTTASPESAEVSGEDLRRLAETYRTCSREITRLGDPPSERLRPVHDIVLQACGEYDEAAEVSDQLAELLPKLESGTSEVREFSEVSDRMAAALINAGSLMVDAQAKAAQIRIDAGQW
ncbi:MAG: hypothetical protein HKP61_23125 [Dactylosporangium sp.]|nr:hypothetical protein [Dactylosporangium sp.]NNJ63772.1 hypothetical protein [Dactylosporangium sp.]